jgi:hypothetical protein
VDIWETYRCRLVSTEGAEPEDGRTVERLRGRTHDFVMDCHVSSSLRYLVDSEFEEITFLEDRFHLGLIFEARLEGVVRKPDPRFGDWWPDIGKDT